jgi:hypothetical protein
LKNKLWEREREREREKFTTYLSGDIGNYGRERDMSLSRGRKRKSNFAKKKKQLIGQTQTVWTKII